LGSWVSRRSSSVHQGITQFVQLIVLAVAIAVVFYTPSIVQTPATGIANALGVH
jgi:hypothetical protein